MCSDMCYQPWLLLICRPAATFEIFTLKANSNSPRHMATIVVPNRCNMINMISYIDHVVMIWRKYWDTVAWVERKSKKTSQELGNCPMGQREAL